MPKHFTLEQAQRALATVEDDLRAAVEVKREYSEAEGEIQRISQRIMMLGGSQVDREKALAHRGRRETAAARLKEAIERIHEAGCLIKDLDIGLIDFPTLYRGDEVYLCFRLGEDAIRFWHGVHEGFGGRKPIDDDFRANHQGDLPN